MNNFWGLLNGISEIAVAQLQYLPQISCVFQEVEVYPEYTGTEGKLENELKNTHWL